MVIPDSNHGLQSNADTYHPRLKKKKIFVIGKFLSTTPHVAIVHVILNKIWVFEDKSHKIDVYEVDSRTMKFRITNPVAKERILRRGMWNIADIPMVVSKWSPINEESSPEARSIPLWVHLKNVPMNMFSWQGLSFITSAVGVPVRLHPETTASSTFMVAKVFVNVDLSKELPKKSDTRYMGRLKLWNSHTHGCR